MNCDKITVLLIEDDHDDAEMIIYALRKLNNVTLTHIDDGELALSYLERLETFPSLILLDLKMPKIDGIQILTALRSGIRCESPIIALISSKEGKQYVESHGVKPDGYLFKPVETVNFLTVLTEIGLSSFKSDKFASDIQINRKP